MSVAEGNRRVIGIFWQASAVSQGAVPQTRNNAEEIARRQRRICRRASSKATNSTPPIVQCVMAPTAIHSHTLTDSGRWMYPRASDLTSPAVQRYSDSELFWIVKNGIRLSGMPAFGRVESDEHIWNLVHYLRTLRRSAAATNQ
jgi:hypothetical protein